MKKNGFTLIELIGIIAIISLIGLVTIPQMMSSMTKGNEDKISQFKRDMESAAQSYVENNWNESDFKNKIIIGISNEQKYCIPLSDLIDNDYVDKFEIDPTTNTFLNDAFGKYVMIENISKVESKYNFSYTYVNVNDASDLNKC